MGRSSRTVYRLPGSGVNVNTPSPWLTPGWSGSVSVFTSQIVFVPSVSTPATSAGLLGTVVVATRK